MYNVRFPDNIPFALRGHAFLRLFQTTGYFQPSTIPDMASDFLDGYHDLHSAYGSRGRTIQDGESGPGNGMARVSLDGLLADLHFSSALYRCASSLVSPDHAPGFATSSGTYIPPPCLHVSASAGFCRKHLRHFRSRSDPQRTCYYRLNQTPRHHFQDQISPGIRRAYRLAAAKTSASADTG